jgi:tRNA threonylcarbamoyl adenosine modification protein YeaZ
MAPHPLLSGGLVLALDTSGPTGHVAVSDGPEILARRRLEEQGRHAAGLVPAIGEALREVGGAPTELVGIVAGEGPGSFTGVRVAAATAKGLARALDIPLYAVSSLAAGAVNAPDDHPQGIFFVLFDARGDRVFAACFEVGPHQQNALIPPHAGNLRSVLDSEVSQGAIFLGSGAHRHRDAIEASGHTVLPSPWGEPTADALLRSLALQRAPPVASLDTWEPRYLKPSSAERAWVR